LGRAVDTGGDGRAARHAATHGRGYPDALCADKVPLESRIILVADALEAMTSNRPYREGRPERDALDELERHSGSQFDPKCVRALRSALERVAEAAPAATAT
jgi:HD-GYP domain-containing protein (c-di-GMP phosphodiesterase class II)